MFSSVNHDIFSINSDIPIIANNASLEANYADGKFTLIISIDGVEKTSLFSMNRGVLGDDIFGMMLHWWMINEAKPVFYRPCKNLALSLSGECDSVYKICFSRFSTLLKHHNDEVMLKIVPLAGMAKKNKKVLMINVAENERFKALHDEMHNVAPDNCFYMSFDNGWDQAGRVWKNAEPVMYLPEFLKKISDDEIKTIVTVNHYIHENYMMLCGFHLPAVCFFLGVELVVFDGDNYDEVIAGQLKKLALNCDAFRRFTFSKTTHEDWDRVLGMQNAHYVTHPNAAPIIKEFALSPKLTALVASHCRLESTVEIMDDILFLFEEFDGPDLCSSLHLCYLATRKLLLRDPGMDIYNQMSATTKILNTMFAAMQMLKYEAIETFKPSGDMEIYGDAGWKVIFPEHYCGKYLTQEEINEKIFSGNYLPIVPGDITHYLQGGGPITDVILKRVPYLCFPALVCSDELSGLKRLECATGIELRNKFSEIHSIMQDGFVRAAMDRIAGILSANMKHTASRIAVSESGDDADWNRILDVHHAMLNKLIEKFILERRDSLKRVFGKFCYRENIPSVSSKYEDRVYVKRIREWKGKK